MKKPNLFILTTFLGAVCATTSIVAASEGSFQANLVKESMLLDIANGNSSIIVGERGHILVTSDLQSEGSNKLVSNYEQVFAPTKTTLTAVTSIGDLAWAVGHDATILGSKDAGKSWELFQQAPELDRPLLDVHFFNPSEGIAVGAYGLFYRTSDGGQTWVQERHASVLSEGDKEYLESIKDDEAFYLEELTFISPHFNRLHDANGTLYLAGESGLVAVSTDQARTWERLELNYLGSFFDVAELPNQDVLAVGLRGNMFVLSENEWFPIATCITTSLNSVFIEDQYVYIAGNNGVILTLDINKLKNNDTQDINTEGCRRHAAISQISTDFSDAISSAVVMQDTILALTSAGIKTVGLGK